jgi:hypothetical protein
MRAKLALATGVCALAMASGVFGQTLTPTAPPPLTPTAPPLAPNPPNPPPAPPPPSPAPLVPAAPPPAPTPPAPPPAPAPLAPSTPNPPPAPPPAPLPAPSPQSTAQPAAPRGVVTKLSSFAVGNWSVSAFSAPGSMDLDFCAGEVPYDNGITLGFRVTRDYQWSMALFNSAWRLTPGSTYSLAYSIDYSGTTGTTGIAISGTGVRVPLAPDVGLFKRFMLGNRLNVVAASQSFGFNLTDTSKLLPDLLSCVESYVGAAPATSNPFAR